MAVTELASAAGLPKSTASRLLSALERRGLVEQDGDRGRLRAEARPDMKAGPGRDDRSPLRSLGSSVSGEQSDRGFRASQVSRPAAGLLELPTEQGWIAATLHAARGIC